MTAIAYINNVYKLYTNTKLGICEDVDLTHPDLCNQEFFNKVTQDACTLSVDLNFCKLDIKVS